MKIAIFMPYFLPSGAALPNYFEYWQKAAAANREIDFFMPTNYDMSQFIQYENIHYLCMTADEFWDRLQRLMGFPIVRGYYKTGEYRAFFGVLFQDILRDYDYWGTTDPDVIFGDILKFIQPYLDRGDDVIGRWSPFRLVKNTDRLRELPFAEVQDIAHPLTPQIAFSTEVCWYYDEINGMGIRYHQAGVNVVSVDQYVGDIACKYSYFRCAGRRGLWGFVWRNGKLFGYNDQDEELELLSIHVQKRKLAISGTLAPGEQFSIEPNTINNGIGVCEIRRPGTFVYSMKFRKAMYKRLYRYKQIVGREGQLVWDETHEYLQRVGLESVDAASIPVKIWRRILKHFILM